MRTSLLTKRLSLEVLEPEWCYEIRDFYAENRSIFEKYEPMDEEILSEKFHRDILSMEQRLLEKKNMIRYYIFENENPHDIVGTVSFRNITHEVYGSTKIGYKIAAKYQRKGYAYEAISTLLPIVCQDFDLHRVEAEVMPENHKSIGLLEKLGFEKEGLMKQKVKIQNKWEDHYLYAYIYR